VRGTGDGNRAGPGGEAIVSANWGATGDARLGDCDADSDERDRFEDDDERDDLFFVVRRAGGGGGAGASACATGRALGCCEMK